MPQKPNQKPFVVYGNLKAQVSIEITASSFDEAVSKAREMDENSFVTFLGEYCDGKYELGGVISLEDMGC